MKTGDRNRFSIVKSIMRSCWESCVLSNKIFKFGHFLMTAHLTNGEKLKYFEQRRRKHSCLCLSIKGGEWICVITWIAILFGSLRHQSIEAQSCSVKQEQARVSSKFYLILFQQRSNQLKPSERAIWPTLFVGCKHLHVWTRINEPTTYDICPSSKHTTTADWLSSNLQSYCSIEAFRYRFNYFSIKPQYKIFMF